MGLSLIGSDWRGVGRKANILLCIIVIIIFSLPTPEAGELGDFVATPSRCNWEVRPIYREGEATSLEKFIKLYTPVTLTKVPKLYLIYSLYPKYSCCLKTTPIQLRKMVAERSGKEVPPKKKRKKKKKVDSPLHSFGQRD